MWQLSVLITKNNNIKEVLKKHVFFKFFLGNRRQLGLMSQRKKRGKMRRNCPSVVFRGGLIVLVCTLIPLFAKVRRIEIYYEVSSFSKNMTNLWLER